MNEKSAYLCIRFREGKWLSDDMMNESGSEPPDWPSILPCNVAREREKLSGKISEKFSRKKTRKNLHSKNKSLIFASAFASKRKAKFFERF